MKINRTTKKLTVTVMMLMLIITGAGAYALNIEKEEPVEPHVPVITPDPVMHDKVYLAVGEYYTLDNPDYVSKNGAVAIVTDGRVKGVSNGTALLYDGVSTYFVEVSDMITAPYISTEKEQLPCNYYSVEENEYMDKLLAGKIAEKGFGTRAGAVEAARFLLLQFPWHMSYFSENGRGDWCDGEGRYSHIGMYLNIYKSEKPEFGGIVNGPYPWGCAFLSNPAGINQINSLDCSGFVTWSLVNGGFNPGDLGAGPSEAYCYPDLGENHAITMESLDEVKVGDLFAEEGHIAILIGIKDGIYYIAESNLFIDIRVRVSTKEELINSDFYAWVDMDEFYGHQDGKLTNFWEE